MTTINRNNAHDIINNLNNYNHNLELSIEQLNTLGWVLTEFYNELSDSKAEIVMEIINKIEEMG